MRIRKGDTVQVLSGKHRGKRGQVMVALPEQGKVIVDGANMAKRHTKPRGATMQGGIIDKDMPLPVSAVAIVCPACGPDPHRHADRRDGPQDPGLPQVRDGPVMTVAATRARPRLKERYDETLRAELQPAPGPRRTSCRCRVWRRS